MPPRPQLVTPCLAHLPSYTAALATGWSPNNIRNVSAEQLAAIREDPTAFLAELLLQGGAITLPDGTTAPKLPFLVRWIWDGQFCGSISLRWQPGSDALPPHVLGHVGYAVVPWKRRHGYATRALRLMLDEAREVGLTRLEITTDPENIASRGVIEANGGQLAEEFVNERYGPDVRLRYLIPLRRERSASSTGTRNHTP